MELFANNSSQEAQIVSEMVAIASAHNFTIYGKIEDNDYLVILRSKWSKTKIILMCEELYPKEFEVASIKEDLVINKITIPVLDLIC